MTFLPPDVLPKGQFVPKDVWCIGSFVLQDVWFTVRYVLPVGFSCEFLSPRTFYSIVQSLSQDVLTKHGFLHHFPSACTKTVLTVWQKLGNFPITIIEDGADICLKVKEKNLLLSLSFLLRVKILLSFCLMHFFFPFCFISV